MTIAEEIQSLRDRIDGAYDAISAKGGVVPEDTDSWHLSAAIQTIPSGEEEDVNGVQSLYSVLPSLTEAGVLSGTLRKGPWHYDMSGLERVDAGERCVASMFGRPGLWSYNASYADILPNVSSVDMRNLKSVSHTYGAYCLFCGNPNPISVYMPSLSSATGANAFQHAFRATRLPCHMPCLSTLTNAASYAFYSAWMTSRPDLNPLSADLEEDYFPSLVDVNCDYAFMNALNGYMPANNTFLDLSALSAVDGISTFESALKNSGIQRVRVGVRHLTYQATGRNPGKYRFQYFAQNSTRLKTAEFPFLSAIDVSETFRYAFDGCTSLSAMEFPSLVRLGLEQSGYDANTQFYYAWRNCASLASISFPQLSGIASYGSNTFAFCLYSDVNGANNWPVCDIYFPRLVTFRTNTSGACFCSMSGQGTATRQRKYRIHIGAEAEDIAVAAGSNGSNSLFYNCRGLVAIYLHNFASISGTQMFASCSELKEIHFAARNEESIKASTGYATKWGAPTAANPTIYFDL